MRILSFLLIVTAFSIPALSHAWFDPNQSVDDFMKEMETDIDTTFIDMETEFDRLLDEWNSEYIEMLGKEWVSVEGKKDEKKSFTPKPDKPEVPKDSQDASDATIRYSKVVAPERPLPDIPATLPKIKGGVKRDYPHKLTFFNTPCSYRNFSAPSLSLKTNDQQSVQKGWAELTGAQGFKDLRDDCLRIREELQLCDWGYLLLTEQIAYELYPSSKDNQALAACALLNLSGYDARLLSGNNHYYMLFHPSHYIQDMSYFPMGGKRYYIRSRGEKVPSGLICDADFHKNPTPIRMLMDRYPHFLHNDLEAITYSSSAIGAPKGLDMPEVRIVVNSSVQKFLADYPLVPWNLYGLAPVSEELQNTLFKVLKNEVAGLGELEAVNKLLKFHYRGFNYATDDEQFGREKPFFFDENFYYPQNDCEDRTILFARLVKDLLGLDVVYLKYPNHLAAGVCFSEGVNVKGPKVTVDGKIYVFCDPTNAEKAGLCPIVYTSMRPEVYKIKYETNF